MEKVYFLVRPSDFYRLGEVDINGEYPTYLLDSFKVHSKFNYLMFEGTCRDNKYPYTVKELFTGKKFDLIIEKNKETKEKEARIESSELGLFFDRVHLLEDIECEPSRISGLLNYMKKDKGLFSKYTSELDNAFALSKYYADEYDKTVDGPKKSVIRSLLKSNKRFGK